MITATTKKQDHRQDSARSAQHRRIVALVRLGDRREAARLAAERDWLVRRELDQLVREQPYSGRWTA
jgi:DNA-binding GntR family transcriptional regulator